MPPDTEGATRVRVCAVDDLPVGEVVVVEADGRRVAVFHTADGVYAIDDRCTHQEAALSDGFLDGCQVECPLHASFFDLRTGAPTGPPATVAVATYPAVVEAGAVHVDLPTAGPA